MVTIRNNWVERNIVVWMNFDTMPCSSRQWVWCIDDPLFTANDPFLTEGLAFSVG